MKPFNLSDRDDVTAIIQEGVFRGVVKAAAVYAAIAFVLYLVVSLAGCGGNSTQPSIRLVASLAVIAGNGQTGVVAQTLATAVAVQAKDAAGAPIPQVVLNWYIITNAGIDCASCSDTIFAGAGITDITGGARFGWQLATRAGPQAVIAWAIGPEGDRITYAQANATALPDHAVSIITMGTPVQLAPGGFLLLRDHAAADDQYWNWVGVPAFGAMPSGWKTSADTAWAPSATGDYILPLMLDAAQGSLAVQVR